VEYQGISMEFKWNPKWNFVKINEISKLPFASNPLERKTLAKTDTAHRMLVSENV
jgi:hypothetical protein